MVGTVACEKMFQKRPWKGVGRCTRRFTTIGERISSYFIRPMDSKKGDNIGGYNRDVVGWGQHFRTIFPGALIQPNSVIAGSQRVLFIKYRLWQGNWWFRVGNEWVGYYPANLFSEEGLRKKADAILFYGEVADSPTHLGKSRTDMGSGRWANERWPFAGYAHNLRV